MQQLLGRVDELDTYQLILTINGNRSGNFYLR